jgi:hypothetical protein
MSILRFLLTLEANSWDEPGAVEVRDGLLVSLAKMILITSRLIITNKRINFFLGGWSLKKVTVKSILKLFKFYSQKIFKNPFGIPPNSHFSLAGNFQIS